MTYFGNYFGSTGNSDSQTTPPAVGYYAAQGDLENRFGIVNIATWSQLDGMSNADGSPLANVPRIQEALNVADATINSAFRDGPYIVPLALTADAALVADWATIISGVWLYTSRGLRDDTKDGDKMQALRQAVGIEMRLYTAGVKRLSATRRWPTATAPTGAR